MPNEVGEREVERTRTDQLPRKRGKKGEKSSKIVVYSKFGKKIWL